MIDTATAIRCIAWLVIAAVVIAALRAWRV